MSHQYKPSRGSAMGSFLTSLTYLLPSTLPGGSFLSYLRVGFLSQN